MIIESEQIIWSLAAPQPHVSSEGTAEKVWWADIEKYVVQHPRSRLHVQATQKWESHSKKSMSRLLKNILTFTHLEPRLRTEPVVARPAAFPSVCNYSWPTAQATYTYSNAPVPGPHVQPVHRLLQKGTHRSSLCLAIPGCKQTQPTRTVVKRFP